MADNVDGASSRAMALFFQVYEGLPRGGPGDPESTRRALALITGLPAPPLVLDIGCGPGPGALELAALVGGRVAAFDLHAPFVTRLARSASAAGLRHRVLPLCADMRAIPFRRMSFDLVWAEGSLYSIGFREGLAACHDMTKPGGFLAASEAVWTVPDPPDAVREWWAAEYPAMASIEDKTADVRAAGFEVVGHFTLPQEAWALHYYTPMRERLATLRTAWAGDAVGQSVAATFDTEIAMFDRYGHTYGYEFFVGRR